MALTDAERDLYEVFAAHHVPYIFARLITDQLFGHPYDAHLRALVGPKDCEVVGEPGDWVLYLGDWNPYGYVIGPWPSWADILRAAIPLVEGGQVVRPVYTREDCGIKPPPVIETPRRLPPPRPAWNPIF